MLPVWVDDGPRFRIRSPGLYSASIGGVTSLCLSVKKELPKLWKKKRSQEKDTVPCRGAIAGSIAGVVA